MNHYYSIEFMHAQSDRWPNSVEAVAAKALKAIGLERNATEENYTRVQVQTHSSGSWAADVPKERAEEYAKELWKNEKTSKVLINSNPFPKPAQEDSEELKAFKKKVFEVAKRTKRDEGWCDTGFKDAMKELGIEVPPSKVRVVLELDFNDHDTELTGDAMRGDVEAFLRYDIDQAELNVKSVEPIKD